MIDGNNAVASAPGSNGVCPPPGSVSYLVGLNQGDGCVQLTIEDGGPNDEDGVANGAIVDPGGVAIVAEVAVEVLPVTARTVVAGTGNVVLMALRLTNNLGDIELSSFTIKASGSGSDQLVSNVNVFVDKNNDGSVDADEPKIGTGKFVDDNGVLKIFMTSPYALPPGQTSLLLTYDF